MNPKIVGITKTTHVDATCLTADKIEHNIKIGISNE